MTLSDDAARALWRSIVAELLTPKPPKQQTPANEEADEKAA